MKAEKTMILEKLQKSEAVYVLISNYTRMPYVVCDPKTFDDEVFLFFEEESVKKEAERLNKAGDSVRIVKVEQDSFLDFYTSLFAIGINCLRIEKGTKKETTIQHNELVRRENPLPELQLENPELHLTALYFMQAFCKNPNPKASEELAEIYEEMRAYFDRGKYIVPSEQGKGIPMLKQQEGKVFLPIFTDFREFKKFNREEKYNGALVAAKKLPELITEGVSGIALNPLGVNLLLNLAK